MAKTLLIYGESGTYKTSQLAEIAEYLYKRYGGITRLATADSGVSPLQEQIECGAIQYWDITTSKNPMGLFKKVVGGYWPDKIENGKADESSFRKVTAAEWKGINGFFIEGITRVADVMMKDLREKRRDTGEPLQAKFEDSGVSFAQGSRGTYGFVQTYCQDWIGELKALPCPWVVVTAHEGKGEDLVTKKTIFGPAIVGKAGTDKVCGWFENSIHTESYKYTKKNDTTKHEGVRGCYVRHADLEVPNVYWPAKLGITPKAMAAVIKRYPKFFVPFTINDAGVYTSGVHTLIQLIDDLQGVPKMEDAGVAEPEPVGADEVLAEGIGQEGETAPESAQDGAGEAQQAPEDVQQPPTPPEAPVKPQATATIAPKKGKGGK